MAREKSIMSKDLETLKLAVEEATNVLCEQVYGYSPAVFAHSISVVDEMPRELTDVPTVVRRGGNAELTLSMSGARVWENAIGDGCDAVEIDPLYMYASSGIALLELANVLNYSTRSDDPVARLRKVEKVFRKDLSAQLAGAVISERTGVNFSSIVAGLDQDDSAIISKIRYALGVSLKGQGVSKRGREEFAATNVNEAVLAVSNYRAGVVRFLSDAIFLEEVDPVETTSAEVTRNVHDREFPYLRIAACMPMNVEYLLNK